MIGLYFFWLQSRWAQNHKYLRRVCKGCGEGAIDEGSGTEGKDCRQCDGGIIQKEGHEYAAAKESDGLRFLPANAVHQQRNQQQPRELCDGGDHNHHVCAVLVIFVDEILKVF